jgi:hypothetical protein
MAKLRHITEKPNEYFMLQILIIFITWAIFMDTVLHPELFQTTMFSKLVPFLSSRTWGR